jgi:sortase A
VSWIRRTALIAVAGGSLLLTGGVWLPAKAALAQMLLRHAWAGTEVDPVRPWPWAETWPVARLEVPALDVSRIVLAGDEGAALAFAPGHVEDTAPPGNRGNTVIVGHRDTVFAFVSKLELGDELIIETADRRRRSYAVSDTEVVHERETWVLDPTPGPTLTLVTCYPLDGTRPSGPLRYVVRAVPGTGPAALRSQGE